MVSDPAPFIANLFLYVNENRYMEKLKKSDLARARNLRHVFRFIDDLISLNDNDEFGDHSRYISFRNGAQSGKSD